MSDTYESAKPHHKHRRWSGKGMVAALGFGRLPEQMAVPPEPAPPADNENVSDQGYVPENTGHTSGVHPAAQMPATVSNATDEGMSYIEAIQAAKDGWRICRLGWSEGIYVFVEDGARILKCTEKDHLPNKAIIDKFTPLVDDVLSNDWEILPMPSKTFLEALAAMTSGQFARRPDWQYLLQIKDGKFCPLDNPQQEYAIRYEDVVTSDWEIHTN